MARFQLWDNPSATLLEETDDLREIAASVQSFIDDAGRDILQDFTLSDATLGEFPAANYSGQEIMKVLQEHLARDGMRDVLSPILS